MEFVFEDKNVQGFEGSQALSAEPMKLGSAITSSLPRRSRRSLPETVDDIEFTGRRARPKKTSPSKVKYINSPKRKARQGARFIWTWQKLWWMVVLVTCFRLLFMENGVVDYYKLQSTIEASHQKLALVKKENAELVSEIHKIQTSGKYQRKVARDHLGVIASNEYLILFSQDSN